MHNERGGKGSVFRPCDWHRARFRKILREHRDIGLVFLLGQRVEKAIALGEKSPLPGWEGRIVTIPHPSGCNRFWNDPIRRAIFRNIMEDIIVDEAGRIDS